LKPTWVFAIGLGPGGQDDGTQKLVTDLYKEEWGMWTEMSEPDRGDKREWNQDRYERMSDYRNALLGLVRAIKPDYFLSVDSDILMHPMTIMSLMDAVENHGFDAAGGRTYLSPTSRHITTWANLTPQGGLKRQDSDGTFQCDAIMALKLMTPAAYNVDYVGHRNGEDIGWSLNCQKAGVKLGFDGRVISKHIMQPEHLQRVDRRVGW
jgi:hypothetical protein